jgi:acyl-CoA thioesterase
VTSDGLPAPGPFSALLGFRTVQVEDGEVVLEADPGPEHLNGGGIVHGGFLSALLDSATGWAAHTRVPPERTVPHLSLSVQYVRAAAPGATLTCRARVVGGGRRAVSVDAEITQRGKVVARASSSHLVIDRPSA